MPGAQADPLNVYAVGNSLTFDAITHQGTFQDLVSSTGVEIDLGYHVQCGQSLHTITQAPSTCVIAPHGEWTDALAGENNYDVLVLQPHPGSTFAQELGAFKMLADLQPDAQLFYYETWAAQKDPGFAARWATPAGGPDDPFTQSRAWHDAFIAELQADGYDFGVIPAGTAWSLIAGDPALYRDDLHASHDFGRPVAASLMANAVVGYDPATHPDPLVASLASLALAGQSSALVGDVNLNGQVEQGDLDAVLQNWGTASQVGWLSGDLNGSGSVEQGDLDLVLTFWGSSSAAAIRGTAVPEPAAVLVIASTLIARRRSMAIPASR